MKIADPRRITLVGAGNVAWHMGKALSQKGYVIKQVLDRTASSSKQLAKELKAEISGTPEDGIAGTDACLICVSDDAIATVIEQLRPGSCLLMHTAGSVSMDVFRNNATNFGVLYPLQTFTKAPVASMAHTLNSSAQTPLPLASSPESANSLVTESGSSPDIFRTGPALTGSLPLPDTPCS